MTSNLSTVFHEVIYKGAYLPPSPLSIRKELKHLTHFPSPNLPLPITLIRTADATFDISESCFSFKEGIDIFMNYEL